jgi:hypothetical protein
MRRHHLPARHPKLMRFPSFRWIILPSSLVYRSKEVDRTLTATYEGCSACHCDRHSHPPSPGQSIFTRPPTDCLAIVYPGRALYPSGDGETQCLKVRSMNLQACLYVLPSRWARLLPTARLDEHRLTENTISSVCAFGEQRKHLAHSFYPSKLPSLSSGDEG